MDVLEPVGGQFSPDTPHEPEQSECERDSSKVHRQPRSPELSADQSVGANELSRNSRFILLFFALADIEVVRRIQEEQLE